jgi:hypothetical protein
MKTILSRIIAALIVASALAGCAGAGIGNQESAMQWMDHQPVLLDD